MRLYDLSQQYTQVLDLIEEGDERFLDTLESIEDLLENKVENYGKVIKSVEAGIEGLKAEEKRLAERRKFMENSVKRMKENVEQSMVATGKKKIKGQLFTFSIQKNPPKLEVFDESEIPEIFFTQPEPVIDKKLLTENLKDGFEVAGARLVQGESLRIK